MSLYSSQHPALQTSRTNFLFISSRWMAAQEGRVAEILDFLSPAMNYDSIL
jgi:hypothetical protein